MGTFKLLRDVAPNKQITECKRQSLEYHVVFGKGCGKKYRCDIVNRKEHKADILLMAAKEKCRRVYGREHKESDLCDRS